MKARCVALFVIVTMQCYLKNDIKLQHKCVENWRQAIQVESVHDNSFYLNKQSVVNYAETMTR